MGDMVSVGQMARSAWQGVRYLKGLVNSEQFVHDVAGFVNPTIAGDAIPLTDIPQGDQIGTRTGNSILVKRAYIRVKLDKHATPASSTIRYALVRDSQQVSDGAPTYENVFSPGGGVLSALNSAQLGRFTILEEKLLTVDTDNPSRVFVINVSMSSHVRYNGSNSTDIQKNGLYLVVCSTENSGTQPTFTYRSRVYFHDN